MQRKKSFVVVWFTLVFMTGISAQTSFSGPALLDMKMASVRLATLEWKPLDLNKLLVQQPAPIPFFSAGQALSSGSMTAVSALADDYYVCHFGFFCKKELQLEKMTRIPLRFRLGSLEQCNWLEGKK